MTIAISIAAALVSTIAIADPHDDPALVKADNACVNAAAALIAHDTVKEIPEWIADCTHHPLARYCVETINVVREAKVDVPPAFVCQR